jgi:hypothetical protein
VERENEGRKGLQRVAGGCGRMEEGRKVRSVVSHPSPSPIANPTARPSLPSPSCLFLAVISGAIFHGT